MDVLPDVVKLVKRSPLAHVLLVFVETEFFHRLLAQPLVKTGVWDRPNDWLDKHLSTASLRCGPRHPPDLYVLTIEIFESKCGIAVSELHGLC